MSIVLHDGAFPVVNPGPGLLEVPGTTGPFPGVPAVADFGASRRVRGDLEFDITSITTPSSFVNLRMEISPDAITWGWINNGLLPIDPALGTIFPAPQRLLSAWSNADFLENDASGSRRFARISLQSFEAGATFDLTVTLLGIDALVVQTDAGATGANVYLSVADVLFRMADWRPAHFTAFPAATEARQQAIWIDAIRDLELVVARCPDGAPVSSDPSVQTLLFPRADPLATDAWGRDIVGLAGLEKHYFDGLILFAEEKAKAEAAGKLVKAPAESEGVVEIEVEPGSAGYTQRWSADGKSGSFWNAPGREEIRRLIFSAFPRRARG